MGLCQSSSALAVGHGHGSKVLAIGDLGGPEEERMVAASVFTKHGSRGPNQDSAIVCQEYAGKEGVFCGVFDGHGRNGHIVSKVVRDKLPSLLLSHKNKSLQQQCDEAHDNGGYNDDDESSEDECCSSDGPIPEKFVEWKEAYVQAFKAMDKELNRFQCSYSSGSTAVTVVKQGNDLIISNLGDSRAILGTLNEEGDLKAIQLTTDLKPNLPHEAERINKRNGRVFALPGNPKIHRVWLPDKDHPGLAMARAFGNYQLKKYGVIAIPQVSHFHVWSQDQFVVLATDGVWDVLSNQEVVSIVWSVKKREDAAKAIVRAAVRRWKCRPLSSVDDCTALCLYLQEIDNRVVRCDVAKKTK